MVAIDSFLRGVGEFPRIYCIERVTDSILLLNPTAESM